MRKLLLLLVLAVALPSLAQTHVFPATDTNNVFTGTNQFTAGVLAGPALFSALPTETDGTVFYCPDCKVTNPCTGSGTGAVATGINGAWVCGISYSSPTFTGTVTFPITGLTQCLQVNSSGVVSGTGGTCGGGAFSAITSSTNTTATMICGTGCSITTTGSGTITPTVNVSPLTGNYNATSANIDGHDSGFIQRMASIQTDSGTVLNPGIQLGTLGQSGPFVSSSLLFRWIWSDGNNESFAIDSSSSGTSRGPYIRSDTCWVWVGGTTFDSATADTAICRPSSGVVLFGSTGAASGKVKAAAYMSEGTTFTTNGGCTETSLTGGASVGVFTNGATGTCTTIVTLGNTATALHGWNGSVTDRTTPPATANCRVTTSNATTATIGCTGLVANDIIAFSLTGY